VTTCTCLPLLMSSRCRWMKPCGALLKYLWGRMMRLRHVQMLHEREQYCDQLGCEIEILAVAWSCTMCCWLPWWNLYRYRYRYSGSIIIQHGWQQGVPTSILVVTAA
jgi:hypothetical protein